MHHQKFYYPAVTNRAHSPHKLLLCVDDCAYSLDLKSQILALHGYSVVATTWPEEALAMMHRVTFTAVVTDFDMPGMNGATFVKNLRSFDQTKPVLLHSGSSSLPHTLLNNVDRFVPKAASMATFLRSVDETVYAQAVGAHAA